MCNRIQALRRLQAIGGPVHPILAQKVIRIPAVAHRDANVLLRLRVDPRVGLCKHLHSFRQRVAALLQVSLAFLRLRQLGFGDQQARLRVILRTYCT